MEISLYGQRPLALNRVDFVRNVLIWWRLWILKKGWCWYILKTCKQERHKFKLLTWLKRISTALVVQFLLSALLVFAWRQHMVCVEIGRRAKSQFESCRGWGRRESSTYFPSSDWLNIESRLKVVLSEPVLMTYRRGWRGSALICSV